MPRWDDLHAQVEASYHALFMALQHQLETCRSAVVSLGKRIRDPQRDVIVQRDHVHADDHAATGSVPASYRVGSGQISRAHNGTQ